ncbi:MAG: adenylate/guanylate cyclase domain-containing protein [Pseudomonadota bacterium]
MSDLSEVGLSLRRAAILFADVASYSLMMARDELNTTIMVRNRIALFHELIDAYDGEVVVVSGDGLFLIFDDTEKCVSFAVEIQERLRTLNEGVKKDSQIWFRIGINHGDILVGESEISGDSVNVASRIEGFARPGQICISGAVYEQVKSTLSLGYEFLGAHEFKNVEKTINVFQVHQDPTSAAMTTGLRHDRLASQHQIIRDQSIVVLPFRFQGDDPTESWFADGLAEDITTNLSRFREFFVIARGSAGVYRDKAMSPVSIGRELGVRYVLGGSVRKAGSRIRVTLQLIDALQDKTVWGEQYNRNVDDMFDLQDEITKVIVVATAAKIQASEGERLWQVPPNNLAAYGFVLKGSNHVVRYTEADIHQALGYFNAALSADSRYARAVSSKSRVLNLQWQYNWTEDPELALSTSFDLARQAVELDGSDARGYGELGFGHLYRKENDAAIAAYERAMQLNPNDADLMSDMADALAHSGRSEEAISLLKDAMTLNPFYPDQYIWNLGGAYFNLKRYEEAIETIKQMQNPAEGRRLLAASYAYLDRMSEAQLEVDRIMAANKGFNVAHWGSVQPDKFEEDTQHYVEGLLRAGLPATG